MLMMRHTSLGDQNDTGWGGHLILVDISIIIVHDSGKCAIIDSWLGMHVLYVWIMCVVIKTLQGNNV